ncbi:ABC transporter substrate-binding protein [Runella sp.]|uniref:ABC transporter substrate-binding protein n=1 Tax=Runella sp. TaxID=1960881 RepID=UPI003D12AD9A
MKISVEDQMNNEVTLLHLPQRIVSLVPSQTELLFDLGLESEIVGITNYCIHPADKVKYKTRIGGTKNIVIEAIKTLKPDLIIGNKEENQQESIENLKKHFPVWMSDIFCLDDAVDMILTVGVLVGKTSEAETIASSIQASFSGLQSVTTQFKTAAYFIWRKPYMVAASHTFIDDMLYRAGFQNVFSTWDRYPEITAAQLKEAQPEYIFLSSEPYPFKEKHITEFQDICPKARISVVDGELFSWYGSRLQHSAAYFSKLVQLG